MAAANTNDAGGPRRSIKSAAIAVNAVATFAAAALAGFFVGYFLDGWLRTSPALTLAGTFFGMAGGAFVLIRETKNLLK